MLPDTLQTQSQFTSVPLRQQAVIVPMIVITRLEYTAPVMATRAYVIMRREQVLVILVYRLGNRERAVGDGKGVLGKLGDQSVSARIKKLQEELSGLSFRKMQISVFNF